ncbi:class I SAM-dependent methyltransferase [Desulfatibacillum aliphaticivorans]|uniref:class I SAM-dependent methyltransferase n=1 Tax=Desulfatibacillum aliphaticivorans TaxID=218208 RepID=UPI0004168877|nr:class I SAM-dependent methyltransferase [Desulfatibacillum aliphaticivorans]
MTIDKDFNQSAKYYDEWVEKALPCFHEIFSAAMEIIPFPKGANIKVLDLGAGTGLFSRFVLEKYPNAQFVLLDVADKMLKVAEERFHGRINQFEFVIDDYRNLTAKNLGRFDLVITSLSIHHLEHSEKAQLFKDAFDVLNDNGMFINIDQIKGETDFLQKLYWDNWLEKVRKKGAAEEQIQASIQRRKDYDKDALVFDQVQWLKEAGFSNVDCIYRSFFMGLFFGVKQTG